LFATTRQFLDDLGLASLDQLPLLDSPLQAPEAFESLVPLDEEPLASLVPQADPAEPELQMDMPLATAEAPGTPPLDGKLL
jgi:segregation and condensation protein B